MKIDKRWRERKDKMDAVVNAKDEAVVPQLIREVETGDLADLKNYFENIYRGPYASHRAQLVKQDIKRRQAAQYKDVPL